MIALIAWPGDLLAHRVRQHLETRGGRRVLWLEPGTLAGRRVTLNAGGLFIEEGRISGVFWRVPPEAGYSSDFIEEDRCFSDVEVRAFWLAGCHVRGTVAPFCPDASAFLVGAGWPLWRHRLARAGVRVAPLAYGVAEDADGIWLPYDHALARPLPSPRAARLLGAPIARGPVDQRAILAGPELLGIEPGRDAGAAVAAAKVLRDSGVHLAEIGLDGEGAVLTVDPFPHIADLDVLERAAKTLSDLFDASVASG